MVAPACGPRGSAGDGRPSRVRNERSRRRRLGRCRCCDRPLCRRLSAPGPTGTTGRRRPISTDARADQRHAGSGHAGSRRRGRYRAHSRPGPERAGLRPRSRFRGGRDPTCRDVGRRSGGGRWRNQRREQRTPRRCGAGERWQRSGCRNDRAGGPDRRRHAGRRRACTRAGGADHRGGCRRHDGDRQRHGDRQHPRNLPGSAGRSGRAGSRRSRPDGRTTAFPHAGTGHRDTGPDRVDRPDRTGTPGSRRRDDLRGPGRDRRSYFPHAGTGHRDTGPDRVDRPDRTGTPGSRRRDDLRGPGRDRRSYFPHAGTGHRDTGPDRVDRPDRTGTAGGRRRRRSSSPRPRSSLPRPRSPNSSLPSPLPSQRSSRL